MKNLKENKGLAIKLNTLSSSKDLYTAIILSALYYYIKNKAIILNEKVYLKLSKITGLSKNTVKDRIYLLINKEILNSYLDNKTNNYMIEFNTCSYTKIKKSKVLLYIPNNILLNNNLNLSEKTILAYVLSYSKEYGNCNSFNETISKNLYLSISMVKKCIKKLKFLKLINSETENKKGCILKRKMNTNIDNIEYFCDNYNEYLQINNIENINENTNIENVENINIIENNTNIEKIENSKIINTSKIENINKASIILLNDLSNIDLSNCSDNDLNKLYFSLKNQMELIKLYKNNK